MPLQSGFTLSTHTTQFPCTTNSHLSENCFPRFCWPFKEARLSHPIPHSSTIRLTSTLHRFITSAYPLDQLVRFRKESVNQRERSANANPMASASAWDSGLEAHKHLISIVTVEDFSESLARRQMKPPEGLLAHIEAALVASPSTVWACKNPPIGSESRTIKVTVSVISGNISGNISSRQRSMITYG